MICILAVHGKYSRFGDDELVKQNHNTIFYCSKNHPLIIAFKNSCIASDFPNGFNKNINRLTATARQIAGCFSFSYFQAANKSIPMIKTFTRQK